MQVDPKTLIGKTVASLDSDHSCNVWFIKFTDGSSYSIETEPAGYGIYIPSLYTAAP